MPVQVAVGIAIQRATVMGMRLPAVGTCLYHPDPAVFSLFEDRTGLTMGAFLGHTATSLSGYTSNREQRQVLAIDTTKGGDAAE
jgi:hypothetical protein